MLFVVLMTTGIEAAEFTRDFEDGVQYYKADNFPAAISAFSKIADGGVNNGKLFYNLGNAYLKNNDIGHAVLWYERALKLMPGDPDLNFNHQYALTLVKDQRENKKISIFRILFFWKYLLSPNTVKWSGVILNMIFWSVLGLQAVKRKKILKMPCGAAFALALVFILTAFYNHYEALYLKEAVILSDEVSVRSGLSEQATELFVLHAGTKVKIEKEKRDFVRIYFSDGKIGWINKREAGVV